LATEATSLTAEKHRVVFISYSHKDTEFVNSLAGILLRYDLQIWKDSKDILIGDNIPKSIYSGIKNSSHFCCIVSASSVNSSWVQEELSFAKMRQLGDAGLRIVPVLIDKVEIPDFLLAYACAHLENRDLSITNPEFLRILKALGTDLEQYSRDIITGPERVRLLECCQKLGNDLALFREIMGNLNNAYIRYQSTQSNRGYDPPLANYSGANNSTNRIMPTTHGSDYAIEMERNTLLGILTRLRADASEVQTSVELLREAWKDADPEHAVSSLLVLHEPLDRVSYISKTVSEASNTEVEDNWWIREKLSSWIAFLQAAERSLQGTTTLLTSWGKL
jgi:hypothetical protein